ncbi:hypothetical protein HHK36_003998 [Tetracentron sinense]|uniref:Uncharacterized protein n=1 Tax=Tetracentron sinense TaxID=13715 RepID=A0A834ZS37_TETSI|nr:hypothetical protein HHK36_003998 [Tetracentron sinense]
MLILKSNYLHRRISFSRPLSFHSSSTSNKKTNYINRHLDLFLSNPISDTQSLLQSHAYIITSGNANNIFIAAKLISLYASFSKSSFSTQVFRLIHHKDTFLWNSIIKSHFSNGEYPQALEFYLQMRVSEILPNHFTIPMAISTCTELSCLKQGKNIHGVTLKFGLFGGNSAVGSSFVHMYCKCGEMEDASHMFDEIPVRDVVSWTTLVIGYVQNDASDKGLDCLREMHKSGEDGERPNFRTVEGGLQACGNLGALLKGRCLHGFAVKTGIGCSEAVKSLLLSMYSKCGTAEEAHLTFYEVPNKDLISWTVIIGVYARVGSIAECVDLFSEMQVAGIDPDGIVISCMFSGFGNSMRVSEGKAFHGLIIRRHFKFDQLVFNALVSMYCKFGCLDIMEMLFARVHELDAESWNLMVFGYGKKGLEAKCIELFREMQLLGMKSDSNSLVSVICSCSQLVAIHLGRSVHCYVIKTQMYEDVSIANSLLGMYGKCGNLTTARRLFRRMHRDIVTWNTLISSYTHNGYSAEALSLFDRMILGDLKPNLATLTTILSACSHLAALEHGERVHSYIKGGYECTLSLSTALVDMYAKCGQLGISREIFILMPEKDVISWNVMISGYGMHGDAKSAMEFFQQMEKSNVKPNGLTFLAALSACTHAGLVEEGKYLFGRMKDYSVVPTLKHYACMVDLLGRSGNLHEAEAMILSMPIVPDGGVWGALLSACRIHNDIKMAERIAKQAIESDPENDGYYVMISNMYSSTGRWDEAERMREMMKKRGSAQLVIIKNAGYTVNMEKPKEFYKHLNVFLVDFLPLKHKNENWKYEGMVDDGNLGASGAEGGIQGRCRIELG